MGDVLYLFNETSGKLDKYMIDDTTAYTIDSVGPGDTCIFIVAFEVYNYSRDSSLDIENPVFIS